MEQQKREGRLLNALECLCLLHVMRVVWRGESGTEGWGVARRWGAVGGRRGGDIPGRERGRVRVTHQGRGVQQEGSVQGDGRCCLEAGQSAAMKQPN